MFTTVLCNNQKPKISVPIRYDSNAKKLSFWDFCKFNIKASYVKTIQTVKNVASWLYIL